jgi:hypothetical protein
MAGELTKALGLGVGVIVAATLPLGSPSALAAGSKHVSASTLLNQACSATLAAPAFRAQGHAHVDGTAASVDIYFGSAGTLMTLTQHGDQTISMIMNGPSTYVKGNQPFWQSVTNDSGATSLLAGRWIDMTSDRKDVASMTKDLDKKALLSQCGKGGSATYVGHATVNGIKVNKVHQASSSESDTYYIENGSTPYILRATSSPSQQNSGDLVFSDYGVQPDTSAPAGAIPIPK